MSGMFWQDEYWVWLQVCCVCGVLLYVLLVCGLEGLGKCVFVECFVCGLLCLEFVDGEVCGYCCSCVLQVVGIYLDCVMLSYGLCKDGVQCSEIVIDQICDLLVWLVMFSQFGSWQVVIIDLVDVFNVVVVNVLFKMLEEFVVQIMLVLVVDVLWCLLQIICFCCQCIEFYLLVVDQVLLWFEVQGVVDVVVVLGVVGDNFGLVQCWVQEGVFDCCCEVCKDLVGFVVGCGEVMDVVWCWLDSELVQWVWFVVQVVVEEVKVKLLGVVGLLVSLFELVQLVDWYVMVNCVCELLCGLLCGDLILLELLVCWC